MLECSARFMRLVLPDADFAICYNNVSQEGLNRLSTIATENGTRLVDVSDLLPKSLRNTHVKNSWWKYAPGRLAPERYEIVMDNDLVLWKVPPTLEEAIGRNMLVALTDGVGQFYGEFSREAGQLQATLRLNAGLLGMPPGFEVNLRELDASNLTDFFHSEQGFSAVTYLRYTGNKCLIPLSEVPQLNATEMRAEELVADHCGGHFCGCSYGHFDFWQRKYAKTVRARLSDMEANFRVPGLSRSSAI